MSTISEQAEKSGIALATVKKRWQRAYTARTISRPWSSDNEPTPEETAIVLKGQKPVKPAKDNGDKAGGKPAAKTGRKQRTSFQAWSLLCIMIVAAAASLDNMYKVSLQIKDNWIASIVLTALFSLAPFAMVFSGSNGLRAWIVSGIGIGYEVFCNTVGIYRGVSGLGSGKPYEVWISGGFIDTVSRMTTIDPKPCALVISAVMALIVAGFFLTALIEYKKC
jgi:hypothetical protein